ncbi:HGxxPAAW family protein [Streptomyces sp. NPDC059816]|uniref:HGxxPAAW family protein n=1 Tax=Streptomyces sp. NPDC059816 TaxID=3346960 RepID=UPI00365B3D55
MSGHTYDHGHTVAGWVGVVIASVGGTAVGTGIIAWRPGIWWGLAVTALAVLVTWALHLAGWGKPPGLRPPSQRGLRVRDRAARGGHPNCLGCRLAGRATEQEATPGADPPTIDPPTTGTPTVEVPAARTPESPSEQPS